MRKICMRCGSPFYAARSDQQFCSARCRYRNRHDGVLVLSMEKKWFDMILSGEKTDEYRKKKPYWEKRFANYFGRHYDFSADPPRVVWNEEEKRVLFRNGYGCDKPEFSADCTIREGYGCEEWGAETGEKYYILHICRIYDQKNILVCPPHMR